MGWISKINSLFKATGLSQTGASLFTFFQCGNSVFCNIVCCPADTIFEKKDRFSNQKLLSFCRTMALWFFNVYTGTDDILLCHELL